MIGFGFILALAGIILLIVGTAQALQNRAFRDSKTVTGTVIYKHGHQQKNGREYLLKLSYTVDCTAYEREVGVTLTEYEAIAVGDQYVVQYRPDKPKRILRPQDTNPKIVKVFLLLGAALIVVGVLLLFSVRLFKM